MGGYVLAFATARPSDGGAGAMYVLQGAKRRD
jgi:DNA-nicking Smr family endonuclease